jgi:hypothetical protein
MTTFTSDDREEEYKKILAEAPNQPGYEDAVPTPTEDIKALEKGLEFFKKLKGDNTSPPHIVDSGANIGINVQDLANKLESFWLTKNNDLLTKVVDMLRMQEVELAEAWRMVGVLRKCISELEGGLDSSLNLNKAQVERYGNNEPVAYIDCQDLERLPHHDCWVNGQEHKNNVPLYIHPAKTLTNEEILCLWDWWSGEILSTDILDFADTYKRALLGEEGLVEWHQEYVKKMNNERK